jgi:hypothetical protein
VSADFTETGDRVVAGVWSRGEFNKLVMSRLRLDVVGLRGLGMEAAQGKELV